MGVRFRGFTRVWSMGAGIGICLSSAGCSSAEGVSAEGVETTTLGLSASASVSDFVVLTTGRVRLADRTRLSGGQIGAHAASGDAIFVGADARVGIGNTIIGRRIVLGHRARAGAIHADELVAQFAQFQSLSPFEAPPFPPPISAFTSGSTEVLVASGQTQSLAPGAFGRVVVHGTLRLSGGAYRISDLILGSDGQLVAAAPSQVQVSGKVTGGDRVRLQTPLGAAALRLIVAGGQLPAAAISLGNDARVTALVLASGTVHTGDRLIGMGAIAAGELLVGHDSRFDFDTGFECSSKSDCADQDPCTENVCVDGQCQFPALSDDALCEPNSGATGTCQSGICVPAPSSLVVQEILGVCVSCHSGASPSAGLDLTDIRAVRDNAPVSGRCTDALPIVAIGDPSRSYLLAKISDTPACAVGRTSCGADGENAACRLGARMPRGLSPLPPSEIEQIRQWIVAGAPD